MPTGLQFFIQAEQFFARNRIDDSLEYYSKAAKKIVKDENLLAPLPALSPDPLFPQETLRATWRQSEWHFFVTERCISPKQNSPDASKLIAF
ncbi:hypothetical protein MPER_06641 [Moniliophthora perniciosa FA553]|nr:hypothetical protein MPER_06641 [Moniliophthora perniciosa FA553]